MPSINHRSHHCTRIISREEEELNCGRRWVGIGGRWCIVVVVVGAGTRASNAPMQMPYLGFVIRDAHQVLHTHGCCK